MVAKTCFLNGELLPLEAARIPVLDRGFLFGDGVYEVVPVYQRRLFCRARHWRRLARNLAEIGIVAEIDSLIAPAQKLVAQFADADSCLYIQVTRGVAATRAHVFPSPPPSPTIFMMPLARVPVAAEKRRVGVACATMEELRWQRADIKSISLLGSVLAAQHAAAAGYEEVIMLRDGQVSEAAVCNVFMVHDGKLFTPLANQYILPGITREIVIELARQTGVEAVERDIMQAELAAAAEIWLTSSTREILPVTQLDGVSVGDGRPGAVFAKVLAALHQFIKNGGE